MRNTRRLSMRAFWGLASWALPLGVVFAVSPALLQALGAGRFGVLMIVLVTPLIASQLELGITSAAVRRVAAALTLGKVDAGTELTTLAAALAAIGLALGAALWFAAERVSEVLGINDVLGQQQAVALIRACAIWSSVSLITLLPGVVARAAQSLILITAVQTATTVAVWIGALALVRSGHSLDAVVSLGIVLSVLSAVATLFALRHQIAWAGPYRFEARLLLNEGRFSAGMFAAQAAGTLVYQGDRMLVAALGSPVMAGAYSLCINVTNKMLAGAVAFSSFAYPHASALHSTGQQSSMVGLVHALDRAIAVILIPLLLPGLLLTAPFLTLWLGDFANVELETAFRVLLIAFAIPAFAVPISHVVAACGRSDLAARFAWLTAIVVLSSMLYLVPRYGLVGAAGAMLIGNATSPAFSFTARRVLRIGAAPQAGRFWFGVALGCAAQLAVLMWQGAAIESWTAFVAIGTAAWAAFYAVRALTGLLSLEEKQILKRFSAEFRKPPVPSEKR